MNISTGRWERVKTFLLGVFAAVLLMVLLGLGPGGSGSLQVSAAGTSDAVYAFVADGSTGEVSLVDGTGRILWTKQVMPR